MTKIDILTNEIYRCMDKKHLPLRRLNSFSEDELLDDIQYTENELHIVFDNFFKKNVEFSPFFLAIDEDDYMAKVLLTRNVMEAFDFNNLVIRLDEDHYMLKIKGVLTNYLHSMINDNELAKGYMLTVGNAENLIKEATLLKENEYFSRAYCLLQLAIEECGKSAIIYYAMVEFYNGVPIDKKYLDNNGYSDHKTKTKKAIGLQCAILMLFGKVSEERKKILKNVVEEQNGVYKTNELKNNSLYVHIVNDKFIHPYNVITKVMVEEIEFLAKIRWQIIKDIYTGLDSIKNASNYIKKLKKNDEELTQWISNTFDVS